MNRKTPLLYALAGGVLVAIVLFAFGIAGGGDSGNTLSQAPLAAPNAAAAEGALTPREIYKRDAPGVVFITSVIEEPQTSPFVEPRRGVSTGSGFVIDEKGSIVTNAHVVQGARRVTVRIGEKQVFKAKIVGQDPSTDLALLHIDPGGVDLQPLSLGSSSTAQVGDPTVAIGNPFGLDRTLTTGVVSAKQRRIPSLVEGFQIDDVLQTDAAINPGNSGGPLIDAFGRVIGVNSQIETGGSGQGSVGIGFAVPVDTAKEVIPQLRSKGRVDRAYLGVSTAAIDPALDPAEARIEGARVVGVQPGSPADRAGLRPGDIVKKIGDRTIESADELSDAVEEHKPGENVPMVVERDGAQRTIEVKLVRRPDLSVSR